MADPTIYAEPPARAERRGGLKTVAEFVTDSRVNTGALPQFISDGCSFPVDDIALCYPSPAADQNDKEPTGIETLDAAVSPFGIFNAVECWLDAENGTDFESRAATLLEQGEDRAIEARLNTWAQSVTATATISGGITPANLQEALARAEAHADVNYLGAPVLLINRGDAVRIGAINFDTADGVMRTKNGNLVLASGKITASTVTAVGALTVLLSPVVANRAPTVKQNTEIAIAERVASILVDCRYAARYVVTA